MLFRIIQLRALQDSLFRVYGQVSAQVWKISTKQNLINPRYLAQHPKHGITGRKRGVPIHPAEHVSSGSSLLAARDEAHLIDDRESGCQKWYRSSSVREDVSHA